MEIQLKKVERTELTHSQVVAPQRESILAAAEIQPEKEAAHAIKFLAFETWVRGVLGSISVSRTENGIVRDSIQRIGTADPANFQLIAALQMEMLGGDRQIALVQSRRIFFWALVGSGVGLIFFVGAFVHTFPTEIAFLSGAIVEIVAGIIFVLYGKATALLSIAGRGFTALPSGE
jgi:hypothetical protein